MKRYTGLSAASIILVISILQGGDGPVRLRFHAGLAPTKSFTRDGPYGSFAIGVSYPITQDRFRLGFDLIRMSWASEYLYKFEERFFSNNQKVGPTGLKPHVVTGFAPNVVLSMGNEDNHWYRTSVSVGLLWGWPEPPDKLWPASAGRISDNMFMSYFLRFMRPLSLKLPVAVMAQFIYVPSAGLISSLLVGVDINLIFWK